MSDKKVKHHPFIAEIVRGDPIQVEGRELVPWVRVTSRVRRRAFLGDDGVGGGGWGYVHMRPVAILDRRGSNEHYLRFRNEAARWVLWLSLIFLAVPMVAVSLIVLSRRLDGKAS
ncbi:MAG: hypothetical protein PVG25_00250 [Anaerolineae bacterium]|jgi:hypothetical protein